MSAHDDYLNNSTLRNNFFEKNFVEQQPHTVRLLRLIRDGNHDHAEAAASQLSDLATTSFSAAQLWDIMGSLQENLTCSIWLTRSNAARALEGVAKALPLMEQRRFLTMECYADSIRDNEIFRIEFLKVRDILEEEALINILENGRRLLSGSQSSYDNAEEYALSMLDEQEISRENEYREANSQKHKKVPNDFVEQRIKLQRRIMATKLFGISSVFAGIPDPERYASLDIITQDVIIEECLVGNHKRIKLAEQVQKRNQEYEEKQANSTFLRSLLISEARRFQIRFEGKGSCHWNPQKLLAGEFVYRMFDSSWYVRHGALLGVLSLIRAWKSTILDGANIPHPEPASSQSEKVQLDSGSVDVFGAWPEDILARSLCVLALDRFGDFSGALIGDNEHLTSNVTASGVISPCREVAGQLVAILTTMAPICVRKTVLNLLQQYSRYHDAWEVRHGALVAGKFLLSVISMSWDRNFSRGDSLYNKALSSWNFDAFDTISTSAMLCLRDTSDDVVSAAVQVLSAAFRIWHVKNDKTTHNIPDYDTLETLLKDTIPQVWDALKRAKNFSSCIVDLLNLIAQIMEIDAIKFLSVIELSCMEYSSGLKHIVSLILSLFNSDYPSVRLSAVRAVKVLAESYPLIVSESRDEEFTGVQEFRDAYYALTLRIFEVFYTNLVDFQEAESLLSGGFTTSSTARDSNSVDMNSSETDKSLVADSFQKALKDAWICLCNAISILSNKRSAMLELEVSLLNRYFHVQQERVSLYIEIRNHVEAADNLANFLTGIRTPRELGVHVIVAIQIFLESPWLSQCELACILLRSLSKKVDNESLAVFHVSLDPTDCPLCLQMSQGELHNTLQNNSLAKMYDSHYLEAMAMVTRESEQNADMITTAIEYFRKAVQAKWDLSSCRKPTLTRVRIEASVAGAMTRMGIPEQITPLVRALMTSFRTEQTSTSRLFQTSRYIADFLKIIHMNPQFKNAETKILSAICERAVLESEDTVTTSTFKSGTFILQSLITEIESWESLDYVTEKLDAIISGVEDLDRKYTSAIHLIKVVSGGLTSRSSCSFVTKYLPPLITLACCKLDDKLTSCASAGVVDLCNLCPSKAFHALFPKVTDFLKDVSMRQYRLPTCLLLQKVVTATGQKTCPFLRILVPSVLTVMADLDESCSRAASSLFARLVQLAPLASTDIVSLVSSKGSLDDDDIYNVFDHLIIGKPLPPCRIPKEIELSLNSANVKLRQYQLEGISWLHLLRTVGINGALCDDMGLGKTLQTLVSVAMAHLADQSDNRDQVSLIVCPSTIVDHWISEIQKFFPGSYIFRHLCIGSDAELYDLSRDTLSQRCNIVITSYSVLRRIVNKLQDKEWLYLVLDEGHLLKNPKTATAKASRKLRGKHKLILTGTIIQNKVTELWATFDFLMPNFLGSSCSFAKEYATPIARGQLIDASASSISESMTRLKMLHQKVLPFILRREKEQVLPELPAKTITTIKVSMTSVQATYYNAYCSLSDNQAILANFDREIASATHGKSQNILNADCLKCLLFLRLLCTHPTLVFSTEKITQKFWNHHEVSGKMIALANLLQEAGLYENNFAAADSDSSILYCNREDEGDCLTFFSPSNNVIGGVNQSWTGSSSKCLIFAQFTRSLDVVEDLLLKKLMPSLNYVRLDGRVPPSDRMEIVNRFNHDSKVKIMLSTTRVGGLGLNLTGANIVIFLEIDYNPYVDIQAMDRAHRFGQTQRVNVYRIVTKNSVEEKILHLQEKKIATCNAIVNTDNSTLFSMGTDRILDIFSIDKFEDEAGVLPKSADLDEFVDCFANVFNDYASLSVQQFTQTLR